jgi:hypothetical protein
MEASITCKEQINSKRISQSGDCDYKCITCSEYCSTKSTCGNRFTGLQGSFSQKSKVQIIYICDECYESFEISKPKIYFYDNIFIVDDITRVND